MVCLVGMILGKMEKRWEENIRENSWEMCLVGRQRKKKKKNWWRPTVFSSGPPNYNLSKIEWKQERKLLCIWKRIFGIWCFATCSSFLFFFSFPSPLHLLPLFTLDFFSSSFIFWFFVSSCFPFYASIFFSFFFTSFLFLFLFFFLIYLLASASSLRFYLFFFSFFLFFYIIIWMPLFFFFFWIEGYVLAFWNMVVVNWYLIVILIFLKMGLDWTVNRTPI